MTLSRKTLLLALTAAGLVPAATGAVVPAAPASAAVVSCHYSVKPQIETTVDDAGHEVVHKSLVIYRVCGRSASEVGSIPVP